MNTKAYLRDCVFGALGALFMLAGDLCLSIVPASEGDSGFFTVRAFYSQIDENSRKPAWHFSSEALSMSRQPECFTFS